MLTRFPWNRSRSAPPLNAQAFPRPPLKSAPSILPDHTNLRELNDCLSALAAVFPDVRPEVFREMLTAFSDVSRLQLVTECLLRNKAQWVQGRWRVPAPMDHGQVRLSQAELPLEESFRNSDYRAAVKATLSQEFKGFSRSSLRAVLAEHNYSYTETRQALLALSSQSWRYSLARMLLRRKPVSAAHHPLLEWRTSAVGTRTLVIVSTNCLELDDELHREFLTPLLKDSVKQQLDGDRKLAETVNEAEAEEALALFDCECCFIPNTFENITACDTSGHYICCTCIRHTINEAIYGQGWARSIDVQKSSLKCVAPGSASDAECSGCISHDSLVRALAGESAKNDILTKFEERLATECLLKSRLQFLRCPFCAYAEFEDLPPTTISQKNQHSLLVLIALAIFVLCILDLCLDVKRYKAAFVALVAILASSRHHLLPTAPLRKQNSASRPHQHFGRKFTCRSPTCGRVSCLLCSATWTDIHVCFQSSRQALRTYVESAITDAIKRTCPQCNVAFVKSSGCNKLVCVCGYTMCYVCRSEIGTEGYLHFCQHFRADPGQACRECNKCDLYRVEDEEVVIKRAKEKAVQEWKEREGLDANSVVAAEGWNAEEEAEGVGRKIVSRRNGDWL